MHTDSLGQIQFNLEVSFHGIKKKKKSWLKRICWHHFSLLFRVFLQSWTERVFFFSPSTILKAQQREIDPSSSRDLAAGGNKAGV